MAFRVRGDGATVTPLALLCEQAGLTALQGEATLLAAQGLRPALIADLLRPASSEWILLDVRHVRGALRSARRRLTKHDPALQRAERRWCADLVWCVRNRLQDGGGREAHLPAATPHGAHAEDLDGLSEWFRRLPGLLATAADERGYYAPQAATEAQRAPECPPDRHGVRVEHEPQP